MIDSHCHLDHEPLFSNINEVINRSKKVGVKKILTISTSIKSLGHVVDNSDLIKQIDLTTKNLKKCGKVKRINSKVLNIKVDKFSAKVFL